MAIIETIWFAIALAIIAIVLIIDPKSSVTSSTTGPISGFFSSSSSGQSFTYQFSAVLIVLFYVLTVLLSYN